MLQGSDFLVHETSDVRQQRRYFCTDSEIHAVLLGDVKNGLGGRA